MNRLPATGTPNHVMFGIDRPGGGVRVYASRDMKDLDFGLDDDPRHTARWDIATKLDHMLVIDAATWGEAYARIFGIWANADREAALEAKQDERGRTRLTRAITKGGELLWA